MIVKKSNCLNCGFYNAFGYCRIGLGWMKVEGILGFCTLAARIIDRRCGTCKYYHLPDVANRLSAYCELRKDFRNFYNRCSGYIKEEGKDLRPLPEYPPKYITDNEQKRRSTRTNQEHTL